MTDNMGLKFEWLKEYALAPIMGVIFLLTWPLIILWAGFKALFGRGLKDDQRIEILRDIAFIVLFCAVLFLIYWTFGFPKD